MIARRPPSWLGLRTCEVVADRLRGAAEPLGDLRDRQAARLQLARLGTDVVAGWAVELAGGVEQRVELVDLKERAQRLHAREKPLTAFADADRIA